MKACDLPRTEVPWKADLIHLPLQSKVQWNYSLKRFSTLRVGGSASCFIDVLNLDDLAKILPFLKEKQIPWFILGKGSNLILPDGEWPGLVFRLSSGFKFWKTFEEKREVHAGAGLADVTFVQRCVPLGWGGLEFLIGVPGGIGGAVAMNAGAHGGEVSQFLEKVWWMDMDGHEHETPREDLDFSYRHSPVNRRYDKIVTSALFRLEASSPENVRKKMEEYRRFREEKQPKNLPNCGSVFKNPPGHFAAQLIDSCGLKGTARGDAEISTQHANFIVNHGDATAEDVLGLIHLAQTSVWNTHQVALEPEVEIVQLQK